MQRPTPWVGPGGTPGFQNERSSAMAGRKLLELPSMFDVAMAWQKVAR